MSVAPILTIVRNFHASAGCTECPLDSHSMVDEIIFFTSWFLLDSAIVAVDQGQCGKVRSYCSSTKNRFFGDAALNV